MKKTKNAFKLFFALIMIAAALNGCLITEVNQPTSIQTGKEFQAKLTITDMTADANAHTGVICVMAPSDWTFVSGTYDSQVGTGSFVVDTSKVPVYGKIDSVLAPPAGMKWIKLLSDKAYTNAANVVHGATIKLKVGTKTGTYNIGYFTTKNSADLLASLNKKDQDNDAAWSDTSMNHKVTVTSSVGIEEQTTVPTEFVLSQNYPNPFNPTTVISFTLPKESDVKLTVFNSLGQEVAELVNGYMTSGVKNVEFNAAKLTSGIYFYKLETQSFSETKKMLLMK